LASNRGGYGRQLIEQALPFSLYANSELIFREDGVSCRIAMPFTPQRRTNLN
jgi:two-component system CheB/CheR fusion protein